MSNQNQLALFAAWAYDRALAEAVEGRVKYDPTFQYIGERHTHESKLIQDNPCPICHSSYLVEHDEAYDGVETMLCRSKRHFYRYGAPGYRFRPKNEGA